MKNRNSLISLAYVKVSKNPLHVFCQYILYVLHSEPERTLTTDVLQQRLLGEFGLNILPSIISSCARVLEKQGKIEILSHGAGFRALESSFDIVAFDSTRNQLQEHEDVVLKSLSSYVQSNFGVTWQMSDAREHLSCFLNKEGYGAQLFLQSELELETGHVSTSLYIGRYIQQLSDGAEKSYLEEIVHGMMILQGIYQTDNYQQDKDQKFKGTTFYLDTKLVLRALGFSYKAQVDSVREMVKILREKYGAKIGIFPQTLREVVNALDAAGTALKNHRPIFDPELKLYSELYPAQAQLMLDLSTNVMGLLDRYLGVDAVTETAWDGKYSIDLDRITAYIEEKCGWKHSSTAYDVEIINQINILRHGDYSVQYAGKNKRPVFVTSNSKLVYTFRDYVTANEDGWNTHALPVISDSMLLYRIWFPYAVEFSNIPALTLSRYAYSAQSGGAAFFEEFRRKAAELDQLKDVDLLTAPEVSRVYIEDFLIRETNGDMSKMTDEMVLLSFEECKRRDNRELAEEITSLSAKTAQQDTQIIQLLAEPYTNKLGFGRALLFGARYCWVLCAAVVLAATSALSASKWMQGLFILPLALQLLSYILDKSADDRGWRARLYAYTLALVKNRYVNTIRSGVTEKGHASEADAVVDYCLWNTPVFCAFYKIKTGLEEAVAYERGTSEVSLADSSKSASK